MDGFFAHIEVKDGEVEKILAEMDEAKETIRRCYDRLVELGFVVIQRK